MAAVGALVVAAVGTGVSIEQQNVASNRQERAQQKKLNQQKATDVARRRQEIRQARIKRARLLQQSEVQGTGGSSAETSATGVIGLDVAASGAFQASQANFAQAIGADLQGAANASQRANTAGSIGSLATNVYLQSDQFQNLFNE